MMLGKIICTLVLSICVKKFHRAREYVEDAGPFGSSSGSPIVQSIHKQDTITDTLQSKRSTKAYLQSLKPHFLNRF